MVRRCFAAVALVLVGCGQGSAPASPPLAGAKLRIELTAESSWVQPGQIPSLSAALVNDGTEAANIVLPGDGSDHGLRTPIVRWSPPMGPGDCGNINPLSDNPVVTLGPGERIALSHWIGYPSLTELGRHTVSLEIENIPDLVWRGKPLGKHDPSAMEMVRSSTPFKAVSNVVEIEVAETDPELGAMIAKDVLDKQRLKDAAVLQALAKAGSDLSKPHSVEHHFICASRADADRVVAWGIANAFVASAVSAGKFEGRDYVYFDFIKRTLPTIEYITSQTTTMLRVAAKNGVEYDGWGCQVVK